MTSRSGKRLPFAAAALGVAGALPFIAGAVVMGMAERPWPLGAPAPILIAYGAVILSFLGGTIWGLTTAAAAGDPLAMDSGRLFAVSVVPSLVAWGALLLAPVPALLLLAAAFASQLLVDRWVDRLGLVPPWWLRLRLLLSAIVIASLIAAAVAAGLTGSPAGATG
ncbi:MAG: DUF3429 domain-containing protein [Rhodospirillales bacterium]|nr:DUF3429 domain-containing protein [Rhodospirillales bacterium]